ncbi:MAG: hypothetical protein PHY54_11560 [Methylococcales bacterium]|nr:hypothetical protein [Methylococcales bacterium]
MQKTSSVLNVKTVSGAVTLITTAIIVTPLCGLIFQCGCDWPWLGLDVGCNFYKPGAVHRCPWCASMATGIFSTGSAIISSVLTAMASSSALAMYRSVNEVAVRTLGGLTVFILVAILTAGLAALLQNYPLGTGGYLR